MNLMSDEFETIEPKAVPLAHSLPANDSIDSTGRHNLKLVILLVIAGVLIGLVFFIAPEYFEGSDRAVFIEDPTPTRQPLPKQLPQLTLPVGVPVMPVQLVQVTCPSA